MVMLLRSFRCPTVCRWLESLDYLSIDRADEFALGFWKLLEFQSEVTYTRVNQESWQARVS